MPLYQAVVLAIIQGLTEFLPVSSTAHLALFPWFAGWTDPGLTFDVALHAGTLVAVLLYFWKMWLDMVLAAAGLGPKSDPKTQENRRLFWYMVIGTVPGAIAGYLFEAKAEDAFRTPIVIGLALVLVALFMWAGERASTGRENSLGQVTLADSIWIGVAQSLAVVPGVSRSGITMSAGLFRGLDRETDARFSFLLSTPIIAGAVLKKGMELRHSGVAPDMRLPMVAGIIVSGLVGWAVIAWLIRYLSRHTFKPFVYYRL
ncbi:MAG TPA: undecaprenyl-diphosphate phosphatase, partial [Terriglobia bacterium]|nr:undecaprenyl-diphosphate phosphatase [Terriglobia bacterium]